MVSESKRNPSAALSAAHGGPVLVAPADVECKAERLDDLELADIVRSRRHETPIPVSLEDL
nr:antitoxin [Pseudomonas frederiksbergensis]